MRILAAILAVLLFLPGACFGFFGVAFAADGSIEGWSLLAVAALIFTVVFFLGRYGFRDDRDIL